MSTMSRAARGVKQNKARKIETVKSTQQRGERLEVLSKPKQQRLRRRHMSTTSRATRSVEQNKARFKIDTETISQQRKMQRFSTLR